MEWDFDLNNQRHRRFLTYAIKAGVFGDNNTFDVREPTSQLKAVRILHIWLKNNKHREFTPLKQFITPQAPTINVKTLTQRLPISTSEEMMLNHDMPCSISCFVTGPN